MSRKSRQRVRRKPRRAVPSSANKHARKSRATKRETQSGNVKGRVNWTHIISFLAVLATVGTVAVGYFSWQTNQRNADVAEREQFDSRFDKAIHNLGDRSSIEVRQGAIYQLESLWKDSSRHRPMILKQLASFIRQNSPVAKCSDPVYVVPDDIGEALELIGSHLIEPDKASNDYSVDLRASCLRSVDIAYLNFTRANFGGADLTNAEMSYAKFSGAYFLSASLDRSVMTQSDFTCSALPNAKLRKSLIVAAKFVGADLIASDFSEAVVGGADFTYTVIDNALITHDQLGDAAKHPGRPQPYCVPPGQYPPGLRG